MVGKSRTIVAANANRRLLFRRAILVLRFPIRLQPRDRKLERLLGAGLEGKGRNKGSVQNGVIAISVLLVRNLGTVW